MFHYIQCNNHNASLCRYVQFYLVNKRQTDVIFVAKGGRLVRAHKPVLSSVSSFLKNLCSASESEITIIHLPDVEYQILTAFLSLLYSGDAKLDGVEQVREFNTLLNMLCVEFPRSRRAPGFYGESVVKKEPVTEDVPVCDELTVDEQICNLPAENEAAVRALLNTLSRKPRGSANPSEANVTADFMVEKSSDTEQATSSKKSRNQQDTKYSSDILKQDDLGTTVERKEHGHLVPDLSEKLLTDKNETHSITQIDNVAEADDDKPTTRSYFLRHPRGNEGLEEKGATSGGDGQNRAAGDKLFTCPNCAAKFDSIHSLSEHISVHPGEKPYPCSICQLGFTRLSSWNTHIANHERELKKPHCCGKCKRRFKGHSQLQKHQESHEKTKTSSFACPVCGQVFTSQTKLNLHSKNHPAESSFACARCEKTFSEIRNLRMHVRTHHKTEKRHKCDVCGKVVNSQKTLKRHLSAHCGRKLVQTSGVHHKTEGDFGTTQTGAVGQDLGTNCSALVEKEMEGIVQDEDMPQITAVRSLAGCDELSFQGASAIPSFERHESPECDDVKDINLEDGNSCPEPSFGNLPSLWHSKYAKESQCSEDDKNVANFCEDTSATLPQEQGPEHSGQSTTGTSTFKNKPPSPHPDNLGDVDGGAVKETPVDDQQENAPSQQTAESPSCTSADLSQIKNYVKDRQDKTPAEPQARRESFPRPSV